LLFRIFPRKEHFYNQADAGSHECCCQKDRGHKVESFEKMGEWREGSWVECVKYE